ncbi:MAG: hypothetical protein HC915_12680 [Anaerolineae bacterium]|nr:hypothetical protein [Anaerolineae bacterium]
MLGSATDKLLRGLSAEDAQTRETAAWQLEELISHRSDDRPISSEEKVEITKRLKDLLIQPKYVGYKSTLFWLLGKIDAELALLPWIQAVEVVYETLDEHSLWNALVALDNYQFAPGFNRLLSDALTGRNHKFFVEFISRCQGLSNEGHREIANLVAERVIPLLS